MWNYEKKLQYPINIKKTDPVAAQIIISQFGGLYSVRLFCIINPRETRKDNAKQVTIGVKKIPSWLHFKVEKRQ